MTNKIEVKSFNDLKECLPHTNNPIHTHVERLTRMENVALWITKHTGSMSFFILCFIWTVIWLSWNLFAPANLRFDQVPAFVLWLFMANVMQLLLTPLIMVGQNIQGKHADLRSEHDYETDKKAEKEIETILLHLEKQDEVMLEILNRIEKLELRRQ